MPTPAATPEGPQSWQDWSSAPPRPAPRTQLPAAGLHAPPAAPRSHPPTPSPSESRPSQSPRRSPPHPAAREGSGPQAQAQISRSAARPGCPPTPAIPTTQQRPNPEPVVGVGLATIQPIVNRRPRNPQNPRKLGLVDRQRRLKLPNLPRDGQRADGPAVHPKPADLTPIDPRTGRNPWKDQERKAGVPLVQRLEEEPARGVPVPAKGAARDATATPP